MTYKLGAKPDKHDKRDLKLPLLPHMGINAPLPANASVINGLHLPVYDQGELGSCTANAGCMFFRFLSQRFNGTDYEGSRLWLYYQERKFEEETSEDVGAQSRSIFRVLNKLGLAPETLDPYNIKKFADPKVNDNPKVDQWADNHKIGAYHRIDSVGALKSCLASGYAFTAGITVYASFPMDSGVDIVPVPKHNEEDQGGHEIFFHGYDDSIKCSDGSKGAFRFRNSWGTSWGDRGDAWYPYANFSDPDSWDAWIGHFGKPWGK